MKHIFVLLFSGQFRKLLLEPTQDVWLQAFRSVFVGGVSFLVDAGILFFLEMAGLHYLWAAAVSFIFGLFTNFGLSKQFIFIKNRVKVNHISEFALFALVGVIGLFFTEALLYLFTDIFHLYFMISKMIATIFVLFWNFGARKFLLYRN